MPYPRFTKSQIEDAKDDLQEFADKVQEQYRIRDPQRRARRLVLRAEDIRGLIETAFRDSGEKYDIVVQNAALLLTFLYTGARPGSILSTRRRPNHFLKWQCVTFRPVRDAFGKTIGFDVLLEIEHKKGDDRTPHSVVLVFLVRSVVSEKNLVLDLGTFYIAHGLRQGIFGQRTLDDLLNDEAYEFKCAPQCNNHPVFSARQSRSSLGTQGAPLTAASGNDILADLLKKYGISAGRLEDTLYAIRRGFATSMVQHMDKHVARYFMGHDPNSNVLERFYDYSPADFNIAEGVLGPAEAQEAVYDPVSLRRYVGPPKIGAITHREVLESHPMYIKIWTTLQHLKACSASGSDDWKRKAPFSRHAASARFSSYDLLTFIAFYQQQLRKLSDALRDPKEEDVWERLETERMKTDWKTIRSRREEFNGPSPLIKDLQDLLIKQEHTWLKKEFQGRRGVSHGADFEISAPGDDGAEFPTDRLDIKEEEEGDADEDEDEIVNVWDDAQNSGDDLYEENDDPILEIGQDEGNHSASLRVKGEPDSNLTGSWEEEEDDFKDPAWGALMERVDKQEMRSPSDLPGGTMGSRDERPLFRKKLDMMRALTTLKDASLGRPCPLCLADDTIPSAAKLQHWKPSVWASRHDVQTHSPWPRAQRLIRLGKQGDRWQCSFQVNGHPCAIEYSYDYSEAIRKHLYDRHRDSISEELWRAIHPTQYREEKDETTAQARVFYGVENPDRLGKRFRWYGDSSPEGFLAPGVFGAADVTEDGPRAMNGLGPSLVGGPHLDFGREHIPAGLFDDDGGLML